VIRIPLSAANGVGSLATLGALAGCPADRNEPNMGGEDGQGAQAVKVDDHSETETGVDGPLPAKLEVWLAEVDNYEEGTDLTGRAEVTITVGATGNPADAPDAAFAFDLPVARIDPGTTVTWEWTGEEGAHDVVADDRTVVSGDPVAEPERPSNGPSTGPERTGTSASRTRLRE
jgi:plastocyanin